MDTLGWVAVASIVSASVCMAIGAIAPALGEARALAQALGSIAQQPDETSAITRTLFVGMAMVESTAIYCFVVTMILIFANPFWKYFLSTAGG
jgi:F-type H+-transporting ATPase subunit c